MRPSSRWSLLAGLAVGISVFLAACSSAATPTSAVQGDTAVPPTSAPSLVLGSTNDATLGAYLTGPDGMTLYVFTTDSPDMSACSGQCATNWPPLTVADGTSVTGPSDATQMFGTITRSDGLIQVTYNHMPLYYYAGDSAVGDTHGQGLNNAWFVAPVSGSLTSAAPTSAAPESPAPVSDAPGDPDAGGSMATSAPASTPEPPPYDGNGY